MFINSRAVQIVEYLKIHKKATISELAEHLFASESTVRRDLAEMEKSGLIARYHGGAILLEGVSEVSIFSRAEQDSVSKMRCAEIGIRNIQIQDMNTIFIDNSSTCLALTRQLDFSKKTVVTNGLHVAIALLGKPEVNVIMPGGTVDPRASATTGSLTTRSLEMLSFDMALVSCAGISEEGAFELSMETAQIKQVALSHARTKILLATEAKFKINAPYKVLPLDLYDCIVTDAPDETLQPYRRRGIHIVSE